MVATQEAPATGLARIGSDNGSKPHQQTALAEMAQRYQISQEGLADVIKKTCIQGECSDAQFRAFVLVANQYVLNPIMREIYAYPDQRRGIVPIVSIDGWSRIVNREAAYDGAEFEWAMVEGEMNCTCTIHVKGRSHPTRVTEWHKECKRNTPPWQGMPRRMLRHKAFIQSARLAFGLGGIYDEDEARDIIQNDGGAPASAQSPAARLTAKLVTQKPVSEGQTFEPAPEAVQEAETTEPETPDVPAQDAAAPLPDVAWEGDKPDGEVATWAATMEAVDAAAQANGWGPEELDVAINLFKLAIKGAKGHEDKVITPAKRRALLDAVRARTFGKDGKIK